MIFTGKFIFEITIIRSYNDDEESIKNIKNIIKEISPNKIIIARIEDERFKKKRGITDERFEEILNLLLNS
ncbi:radical SAM protein [Clostridium botulinum]|nr:radical SAM protein [Clostridium botulinum B2 267]MBY6995842.1 radical SAM protein [Clostridium botulinum]MBY7011807.1 radical SAM protein [Clostridium botulinum]MCS6166376.1 radical SAM protein [Clostridium botulinum]NEZ95781.1 radical SAM protein [Clostridium botulinum]